MPYYFIFCQANKQGFKLEISFLMEYCIFQLRSPKSEHVLQALTENDMHQWIAAIQVCVLWFYTDILMSP